MLQWHKDLIRLRRSSGDLTNGALAAVEIRFDEEAGWFVMERGRVRVAFNLGKTQATLPCEDGAELLLASDPSVKIQGTALELGPDSVGLFRYPQPKLRAFSGRDSGLIQLSPVAWGITKYISGEPRRSVSGN